MGLIISIIFVMRYAAKVKQGQYKDDANKSNELSVAATDSIPEFTSKRKAIITIFGLTFLIMIISVMPEP
mgnify:FL=1